MREHSQMWALILHGGAKTIEPDQEQANRAGCLAALRVGVRILESGGTAVDAAEAVVKALEDNPVFNAGVGSVRNAEGEIEACAAMMDGRGFNVGAVAAAKNIRNPVSAARAMLMDEPILIAGDAASDYARERGVTLCEQADLISEERSDSPHDTVGCVARDLSGSFAVAVSTGGVEGKPPGRVGDSPQPGCGFYCDDKAGGVVFSGDGEHIARMISAARAIDQLNSGSPDLAIEEAVFKVGEIGGEAGGVAISAAGEFGWTHNSKHFAVAFCSSITPDEKVYLSKEEANG